MHRAGSTLYIVFVDFTKEFDTVGRTGLWQLLGKYGCPEKFTTMIESLHTGIMVNVRNGGELYDTFSITNGVKQWCVLTPTLFSIFLSAMLEEAFRDMGDGIYIQSRQNADLFTVAHFRAKTKKHKYTCERTAFCRRQRTNSPSAEEIQRIVDGFANESSKFGPQRNHTKPCERIHVSRQYNSKRRSH